MTDSLEVLMDLRNRVDLTIKEIETGIGTVYESKVPTAAVGPMIGKHAKFMEDLTGKLDAGSISIAQFDAQVQVGIQDSFTKAYAAGKGVKISDLTDGDVEFLRRATQAEFEFAAKFGRDIESGGLIMPRAARANMYGGAVNGMAWNGMVESMPDDSRFNWVLGAAEHCCLTSNSVDVITVRGILPLKDVRVGDLVFTHKNRWRRVVAKPVHRSTAAHRYAVLVGEDGRLFGLTDDHKLWTRHGWLTAREVSNGQHRVVSKKTTKNIFGVELRQNIREDGRKSAIGQARRKQESFVLSQLLSEDEGRGGSDPAVRLLRQGIHSLEVTDRKVQVGEVLLLDDVCEQGSRLYDLSVEEDHSFVAGGLVVSNSDCITLSISGPYTKWNLPTTPGSGSTLCRGRCQCRITAISGPMTKDEKEQASKYGSARDQGVKDMLDVSPPKGMRLADKVEQEYIDSVRNEINFERRQISQLETGTKEWKNAIHRRSNLNGELIEFIEQESIFEVPVYSVDEVISAADIGVKAQGDIMLTGLDGGSLDVISDKQLDAMVSRYEKVLGDELPKDSAAAKKATKKGKK